LKNEKEIVVRLSAGRRRVFSGFLFWDNRMSIKKLKKDVFRRFIDNLIRTVKVIGVQAKGDKFDFGPLSSAGDLRLDYDVTLQPPKKFFLPPVETLITYEVGDGYNSQLVCEQCVLMGVHP